jgi:two-component system sensor histidine kinase PilS (NtrC family)
VTSCRASSTAQGKPSSPWTRSGGWKTVRDLEADRVRQDGSRITVYITRAPLFDRSGAYLGSTGIVRNVTDLKEMEARLFEKERLAAVGELSARVAHEVRNPLAGIRGACEILSEGGPESDSLQEIAGEVLHQVDRLNATVEDLLLFARPRAPDPLPTDVREVLDHALSNLADDERTRAVKFERRYDPNLPALDLDPQQMEQVFLNLLQNAAQALDYNGTVTVATSLNGTEARIVVRDSGPGIADEVMDKLFDPFVTTRTKGTGLGLAIVKNIVQAHGGAIHVQSPRGGGAEFTVTLPLPEDVPSP